MQQSVYQGAAAMTRARMHDHAGRLIDHDDISVFVQNFERQFFRYRLERG